MNNREAFNKELTERIKTIAGDNKSVKATADVISKKRNIPIDYVIDILTLRDNVEVLAEPIAYSVGEQFNMRMEAYFDAIALAELEKWKYIVNRFKFPIKYNMIQVADDQWIGRITAAELMKLRDAQIINYNEEAQRVMRRTVKGDMEFYAIALNRNAIANMEKLYKNGTFISNTITLNMPEDTVFDYDEDNMLLTIKKMQHFDITDGYHRYIAMSNLYNLDKTFDYPMELRITNYSIDKSRQLIWQEDQKTKMSKVDSDSLNLNAAANKVVQKLNMDPKFNLAGSISQSGVINAAELSEIIRATYFQVSNTTSKKKELEDIIRAQTEIRNGINAVTETNSDLMDKRWNRYFLYACVYNIYTQVNPKNLMSESARMAQEAKEKKMFAGREVKRIDLRRFADMQRKGAK